MSKYRWTIFYYPRADEVRYTYPDYSSVSHRDAGITCYFCDVLLKLDLTGDLPT
jgi:hypothetical protein